MSQTAGQEPGTAPPAPVALVPRKGLYDMILSLAHLESPVTSSWVFIEIAFIFGRQSASAFQTILKLGCSQP